MKIYVPLNRLNLFIHAMHNTFKNLQVFALNSGYYNSYEMCIPDGMCIEIHTMKEDEKYITSKGRSLYSTTSTTHNWVDFYSTNTTAYPYVRYYDANGRIR